MTDTQIKKEIDKNIFKFEPTIEKYSDDFWAYRILFSTIQVGPSLTEEQWVNKIIKFWNIETWKSKKNVSTMVRRLCRNKVIRFGKTNQNQFLDSEIYNDGIGFALGACICRGMMKRVKQ